MVKTIQPVEKVLAEIMEECMSLLAEGFVQRR